MGAHCGVTQSTRQVYSMQVLRGLSVDISGNNFFSSMLRCNGKYQENFMGQVENMIGIRAHSLDLHVGLFVAKN